MRLLPTSALPGDILSGTGGRVMEAGNMITPKHFVRFYEDDSALVKEISYFIKAGLVAGHAAIGLADGTAFVGAGLWRDGRLTVG